MWYCLKYLYLKYFLAVKGLGSLKFLACHNKKPVLLDAPIDRQIKLDLVKLLDVNKNAFAEDERQTGTTPLIQMSIDTGHHQPIAKKPLETL